MSRRVRRRATAARSRRRAAGLGVAVPAVVAVGALPALATHSGADDFDDVDLTEEGPAYDEFSGAMLIDADDELTDEVLGNGQMVEDNYDPFENERVAGDGEMSDAEEEPAAEEHDRNS